MRCVLFVRSHRARCVCLRAPQVLRLVDEIYVNTIKDFGLYDDIWQAFAVFLPIKSVGVQGDQRTHSHVVGLRAVTSSDGMTADWFPFSPEFLRTVSARICNQVREAAARLAACGAGCACGSCLHAGSALRCMLACSCGGCAQAQGRVAKALLPLLPAGAERQPRRV